jgi:uroporphyrinogen-III synthase
MGGKRVLVTRPEPQATATAALLRARGHVAHVGPVARIERLRPALPPAATVDAIILTSANAAFALADFVDLPVFAVGEATARAARAEGAPQVTVAEGDWRSLARLLAGPGGPSPGGRLLHLAGAEVRGDLPGAARAAGFGFERRVVYAARAIDWLDPATLELLAAGALDAVLFFSPAHATIWRRLIERAAFTDRLFPLAAIALSEAVAEPLKALPWRRIGVAAAPEVARLIDRLEALG